MSNDRLEYDILLVGGSPSNLALAHHLVDLAKESGVTLTMALLEKGKEFGAHIMSGAVVNPKAIERLFPDYAESGFPMEGLCTESHLSLLGAQKMWDVPNMVVPPGMNKTGYAILTLTHVVYWMANRLKDKLKDTPNVTVDFYPGFAALGVLIENDVVTGVRVGTTGHPDEDNVYGKVVCFGDKGFVSRDVVEHFKLRPNPQIWSVGVKEVWEIQEDVQGKVWHTLGHPITDGTFGGGFVYGMKDKKLTIGLCISLDSANPNINPQQCLQEYKKHPWLQKLLEGGKMLKYGAAVLPEGGYYSLPTQFQVPGALILGDALGLLNVQSLSGVDKALECGYQAAEVIHEGLQKNDLSISQLSQYQTRVMNTFVGEEMKQNRYFRYAFSENPQLLGEFLPTILKAVDNGAPLAGFMQVGLTHPVKSIQGALRLKFLLDGNDIGPITYKPDAEHIVPDYTPPAVTVSSFNKETIYSRPDAVFYANPKYHEGNKHIDEFNAETCVTCITRYDTLHKDTPCVSDCTAEVHRIDELAGLGRRHGMSLENCVQCRTCEIVCPEVNLRVNPAEQGSGPDFLGL